MRRTTCDPFFSTARQLALILLPCMAFCHIAGAQTVRVWETFDIGEMTPDNDPGDPLDAAWSTGDVIDDSAGIGTGNALSHPNDVIAEFEPFQIPNLGDWARLSWDFRITSREIGSPGNSGNGNFGYRIYLTDTPQRSTGYGMRIGTGGDGVEGNDGNGIGLRRGNQRMGPYEVDPGDPDGFRDGQPTQNGTFTINDNDLHSASLLITRTIVETTIAGVPTGPVDGIRLDGVVDGTMVSGVAPFGFEDAINIQPLDPLAFIYVDDNGAGEFVIDNVRVEFVPEPSAGLLGMLAAAGLLGWRRRRQ